MGWRPFLYVCPYIVSLAISLGVGLYCRRRRAEVGAATYAMWAFSQASWTLGFIFELISPDLVYKVFWDNVQFISSLGSIAFLIFALQYSDRRLARPTLVYGLLALPIIATIILAFTDPWHGLIRPQARLIPGEPFAALLYDLALPIWLWGIYYFGLLFVGDLLLAIQYLRSHPLYRTQAGLILAGNLLPVVGSLLTATVLQDAPYRDITPFTFALSNLIVAWALFRYRLFDIVPLARDMVIENLPDMVIVLDAHNRVVDLNRSVRRVTGLLGLELIGQSVEEIFSAWPDLVGQYLHVEKLHTEIGVDTPTGRRYFELKVRSLYDGQQRFKGRIFVGRDITDQKEAENELRQHRAHLEDLVRERTAELTRANQQLRQQIAAREHLEQQLRQSQKMEAVGRLAGGIAHDFNNLLVPVIGYAELGMRTITPDSKLYDYLGQIRKAAERSADLTRQILAFSRQQVLDIRVLDLNEVIVEFRKMIQPLIEEDIELQTFLAPSLYQVKGDKAQIEQILMNLAINARDAMPGGGKLIIETANVSLNEVYLEKYGEAQLPGRYVMLAVSDSGHGIDSAIQDRIFEPFFTTKERGKGTGLGLSTVFGIVKQHQGNVRVYSEPGQGATFKIYLPQADDPTPSVEQAAAEPASVQGSETILVVEDEAMVRMFVCETLEAYGYQVLEAGNPTLGLQLAADYQDVIHLLLTDMIMPNMNGHELYQKLVVARPDLNVLYMSGYIGGHRVAIQEGLKFLQKPFTIHTLMQAVKVALSERAVSKTANL